MERTVSLLKTKKSVVVFAALGLVLSCIFGARNAFADGAAGQTVIAFSPDPAALVAGNDVTITTTTTSSGHPEKVDSGKIHIQIATDGAGNPVPSGLNVLWVRIDAAITGPPGGGLTLVNGVASLGVDLDALNTLGLGLNNPSCGDVVGFRAQYVTGGGQHRVETHFSSGFDLAIVCASEGCSHGYWKTHTNSWEGRLPGDLVIAAANFPAASPYINGSDSLMTALKYPGGSEAAGAARILLRNAVASLLNALHSGVDYPMTVAGVLSSVNAALATGDQDTMLALEDILDRNNNLGCPLN